MNILLNSDFLDYYDHHFCSRYLPKHDSIFQRIAHSKNTMSKLEQFEFMSQFNLCRQMPQYGLPGELAKTLDLSVYVVVYLDQYAHQGEGKELMLLEKALLDYPDNLACEYIGIPSYKATSIRHLQIGYNAFKLRYTGIGPSSENSLYTWRSNYAQEVEIEYLGTARPFLSLDVHRYPLFAIDSILGYGVDFNTAPQIRGTGLEDIITPYGIYAMLEKVIAEKR